MKILSFFPYSGKPLSGGERSLFEMLSRWSVFGNQIHVITTLEGKLILSKRNFNFTYSLYKFPRSIHCLSWYLNGVRAARAIPNEKFDFIYCNEPYTSVIPAFLAKKKLGIPLIIVFKALESCECSFSQFFKNSRAFNHHTIFGNAAEAISVRIRNMLARRADALLAVSEHYKNLLSLMGIERDRIYIVKHGVDTIRISSIKVNNGKDFDACFMGALSQKKGIIDLIHAWKEVTGTFPNAKLAIIGTGSKEFLGKLRALISRQELTKNIVEIGWLDDEKYCILKKSSLFLFPSYAEGFALAICEAMACGLPVVAYDLKAYRDTYMKGIITVPTGDVKALGYAAVRVLKDQQLQLCLSKDAVVQAKEYDWDKSAWNQLNLINKILGYEE